MAARLLALLAVAALAVAGGLATTTEAKTAPDHAVQAWNILPPGQAGGITFTTNATDQAKLYDGLTPLGGSVTDADIRRFFKRATLGLGTEKVVRTERPRAGVVIRRDRFGVPHIEGKTRADVTFGAGWATAEDRQLIVELLRGPGRIAALDVPGVSAFGLALSGRAFVPSAATEARLARQFTLLRQTGARGRQIIRDIDAYVAGINAYYRRVGLPIQPWTRTDIVAIAALLGGVFGAGGGDEVRRSQLLASLQKRLGAERGREVWEDLRQRDDPEARVAVEGKAFRYGARPVSEVGNVVVDAAPLPLGNEPDRMRMSNALLVGRSRSATGKPLFVAGPQLGQYYPQIFMELDLKGGGFDVRGGSPPGLSFLIVIGRGLDYAWSLTSAGSDLVDQYVETLCDGSDTKYVYNGACRDMTSFSAGTIKGRPGEADTPVVLRETVHGPVVRYATVGGTRVAITSRRSTRGRELLSTLFFSDLSTNAVRSARDFVRSAGQFELTFNALYADSKDIAQITTGRLPIRPTTVDPGLPTKGTGEYEWRGFAAASAHAQVINPKRGFILNWNNKPARGYAGADHEWTWGSVQRVDLLWAGIESRQKHTIASVVGAMNRAATQDLRAVRVLPVIDEVLQRTPAPTARASRALDVLRDWRAKGSSRLDGELDGKIDHPGAAVLDASWNGIVDAVLTPVLGPLTADLAALVPRDDPMNPGGSSFYDGWWSYVDKDLRTLLGKQVRGAYRTRFCGGGAVLTCAQSLWAAIDAAAARLETQQGSDPTAWRADATAERIRFAPGILPETMRGTNRPTFQQVMSFRTHR